MEDKLIFPIGFDLEKAVNDAGGEWDKKYAEKLEKLIAKRPVNVKLKLDTSKLDSLDSVKKRLSELKIEPITPETKAAIKELASELRSLASALSAVQKYSSRVGGTREAVNNSKILLNEQKAAAARELARQRAARAEAAESKLEIARLKAAAAASRAASETRHANKAYQEQSTYLERLIKRMAIYASVGAVANFVSRVREVTAEFELQRVSLGAIIQDQTRANALFSEIKSFALKSPVSILDLTKYTKQLAAYKIGVEELFETTKKLTDASVGLGVSMDRVVLAYGQTRATGYLRASEIRQFTEMGVPIVEELAAKLSKMNGELVTVAQVMDMVSKRAISFEMVKEVFDDMTSAGGMFYNMQEKQGNNLYGMWAKLGDAASVMYEEIGNTEEVNSAMKGTIQLLTDLMKNWREVGRSMEAAGVIFAAIWSAKKVKGWQSNIDAERIAANKKYIASSNAYRAAIQAEQAARASATSEEYRAIAAKTNSAKASYAAARAEYIAASNTTIWSKAINKLKVSFMGNWITLLTTAIAAIGLAIYNAYEKANRLKNTLKDISEESGVEQMKSVRNFESLANMAVNAADGSRKQKEAIDELSRTYKDIIPQERLTIENLRAMKGNYDSLTGSIKTYVAEQMKQKQINAIVESTGAEMLKMQREFQDQMKDTWSTEQVARFMASYERIIREDPTIGSIKARKLALEEVGVTWDEVNKKSLWNRTEIYRTLDKFEDYLKEQVTQVNAIESAWNNNYTALGRYGNEYEKLANKIKENPISAGGSTDIDEDKTPYLFKQQQQNLEILQVMIPTLKKIMSDAGVVWQDGWANIVTTIDKAQPQIISTIDFNAINQYLKDNIGLLTDEQRKAIGKLQDIYYNIGIPEEVVRYNRKIAIDLANSMNDALSKMGDGSRTALDNVTKYFMKSGQSVNEYAKTLDDALKELTGKIAELEAIGVLMSPNARKELEDLKTASEFVKKLRESISAGVTESNKSSKKTSDERLSKLNEIEHTLTKINQKYEELRKKEGDAKALEHIRKIYGDTLEYVNKLGKQFKLKFKMPTELKELQEYRREIKKVIETLKMKGYEKAALELQAKIDTGDIDQLQKNVEDKLKLLSERISRTKTAKEFYERILSATGDVDLAASVSMSIYGDTGAALQEQMAQQISDLFGSYDIEVPVDIVSVDNKIDYNALQKYADAMEDKQSELYKELSKIAQEGQKNLAKTYEGYLKDLEKAKTYSDKRIELARTTAQKIAEIEASTLPQTEKKRLATEYKEREGKEAAKLEYEAFKDMPMYVQMFDDLDNASTTMLRNMQSMLQGLKGKWGETLEPTQLKEMQSRLNAISEQLAKRNPFKAIGEGIGKIRALNKEYGGLKRVEKELTTATQQLLDNKVALNTALQAETATRKEYDKVVTESGADSKAAQNAKSRLNAATALVNQMRENVNLTEKEVKLLQDIVDKFKEANDEVDDGFQGISAYVSKVKEAQDAIKGAVEEWSDLGDDEMWNTIFEGLDKMATSAEQGGEAVAAYFQGDYFTMVTKGISAVANLVAGIGTLFYGSRVAKANKEIKRQQEILENLEYTYGRLQAAADKLFGTDYISNYNQQIKILTAQAQAYQKQAEAEKNKGKKADKDKLKDYENSYRDTMDKIKDMEGDLASKFLGTDRTSAAREFAKSWMEAKASFASTTDAIKSKYKDLIQSMIVEGFAAKVIDSLLKDVWGKVDSYLEKGDVDNAAKYLTENMDKVAEGVDNAMNVWYESLKKKGIDIKDAFTDSESNLTGIKREYATASEDSINGLAQGVNTQNFYISQIRDDVSRIAQMMGGDTQTKETENRISLADLVTLQNQHLSQLPAIADNTARTAERCERAAIACEDMAAKLGRVIKPRNVKSEFVVNTQ